jgi:RecG-like helicase
LFRFEQLRIVKFNTTVLFDSVKTIGNKKSGPLFVTKHEKKDRLMYTVAKDQQANKNLNINKFREVLKEIVQMINNISTQKNVAEWKDLDNIDIHFVVSKANSSMQPLHCDHASNNCKILYLFY